MNKLCAGVTAVLVAAAGAGLSGCAQPQAVASSPGMMMAKMQELGTPGSQHELLRKFTGTWAAEAKFWMEASQQEPDVSKGVMTVHEMLGGRYIHGDYKGSFSIPGPDGKMQEMQFNGHMLRGYSNADKRFESVWIDSESTSILWSTGQAGGDGRSIQSTGRANGADMAGNVVDQRMWETFTMVSGDKWVQEMWGQCGNGPKFKNMEITYTRTGR